jgi:hypothetical protein
VIVFVDESVASRGRAIYVIGIVMVEDHRAGELRAAARAALRPGQRWFKWNKESAASRVAMLRVLDSAACATHAYITPTDLRHQELARQRCLRAVVGDHGGGGVQLVVDQRGDQRDALDRRLLAELAHAHPADDRFRYDFLISRLDPGLWLADLVAGAVRAQAGRIDRHRTYGAALPGVVLHRVGR